MIGFLFSLALAAANTCLYASFARPYEAALPPWSDLGMLAGGFGAFLLAPLLLADGWNKSRRQAGRRVDGPRTLLTALAAWNAAAAAAVAFALPRQELAARAKWLPERLWHPGRESTATTVRSKHAAQGPAALRTEERRQPAQPEAAAPAPQAPALVDDGSRAFRECKSPDGELRISDAPCGEGEVLTRLTPITGKSSFTPIKGAESAGEPSRAAAPAVPLAPSEPLRAQVRAESELLDVHFAPELVRAQGPDFGRSSGLSQSGRAGNAPVVAPTSFSGLARPHEETRAASMDSEALELMGYVNQARATFGRPALQSHPALTRIAHDWAEQTAAQGRLANHLAKSGHAHAYYEHFPAYQWASEIAVAAPNVREAFELMFTRQQNADGHCLQRGGSHCRTLLDSRFQHLGIGHAWKHGQHWLILDFAAF